MGKKKKKNKVDQNPEIEIKDKDENPLNEINIANKKIMNTNNKNGSYCCGITLKSFISTIVLASILTLIWHYLMTYNVYYSIPSMNHISRHNDDNEIEIGLHTDKMITPIYQSPWIIRIFRKLYYDKVNGDQSPNYNSYDAYFKDMILRIRKDHKLDRVEPVTEQEFKHSTLFDRSMNMIFLNMMIYLNQTYANSQYMGLRDRTCISMHHFIGYKGKPKKLTGLLLNDGSRFLKMVNLTMVGRGELKTTFKYSPTQCPKKVVRIKKYRNIDVKFRKFDLKNNLQVKHKDRFYFYHFEGEPAFCLQVVLDEFKGINYCDKKHPHIAK